MDGAFRRTVVNISHALSAYDIEQIVYLFGIPEQESRITPLSVLKRLEREGYFSSTRPEGLEELLRDIHRNDLSSLVQKYSGQFTPQRVCCGQRPCACQKAWELIELCVTEACNTRQKLTKLRQLMERLASSQPSTQATEQVLREARQGFQLVQSEFQQFMISPLTDLKQLMGSAELEQDQQSVDSLYPEGKSPHTLESLDHKPDQAVSSNLKTLVSSLEDYDSLDPKGSPDNFAGRPITPSVTTRAVKVAVEGKGHKIPSSGSPVQRQLWRTNHRGSVSSDYSEPNETDFTDDSGFAELRAHRRQSIESYHGNSNSTSTLPHDWRESRVYTTLDPSTTNMESSEYMRIKGSRSNT